LPKSKRLVPSIGELRRFQRDLRRDFDLLVRGRAPRRLLATLNRQRCIGPEVVAERVDAGGHVRWRLVESGRYPQNARELMLQWLVVGLTRAQRLERCEECGSFFFRRKDQYQRFCSPKCSTKFHNRRKGEPGSRRA